VVDEEMVLRHICEVCGKQEDLTPAEGFYQGWDYPPRLGSFGVVSPRTCGDCGIDKTLYWRIINTPKGEQYHATDKDIELVKRIQAEPESILVSN
jgi:hypothetical protein